uniref:GOLGA2L5 domain-containing protein n=1 Tax=Caenorhabditis tropicalis TaxID=1561998 RepID=A0A1I7SZS2_9PELO
MLEPVLPPFLNNRYIGDDIQTIISSDIEHLTRVSSRSNSPERGKTDFEKELSVSMASPAQVSMLTPVPMPDATLPNPEDILNQAINGLRKELMEYKKANQILQSSQANLEREMEESRFGANEKVVSMLNEEREHFNQEISQLRVTCSQAISEKLELEEKYRNSEQIWNHTEKY